MLATLLAFGVLINFLRLGFRRYWQRQGFCSLILLQQSLDGGVEDVMALTQELSWVGLHVTATETCVSAARRRTTNVQMAATCEASIFRCSMNQMDLQARD